MRKERRHIKKVFHKKTTIKRSVEQYLSGKRHRRWMTIPKNLQPKKMGFQVSNYFVCIDPHSYRVLRIFKGTKELEFEVNMKNLQGRLYKYIRNDLGKNADPTLFGYIIIKLTEDELSDLSMVQLEELVQKKAIDKIILLQMERIRININTLTEIEKQKTFEFLSNVESPNPTDIYKKIKL